MGARFFGRASGGRQGQATEGVAGEEAGEGGASGTGADDEEVCCNFWGRHGCWMSWRIVERLCWGMKARCVEGVWLLWLNESESEGRRKVR